MASVYEQLQKSIANMKAEQLKKEIERIAYEKRKRYEYHKAYNARKKAYEAEVLAKAKELGLAKK